MLIKLKDSKSGVRVYSRAIYGGESVWEEMDEARKDIRREAAIDGILPYNVSFSLDLHNHNKIAVLIGTAIVGDYEQACHSENDE
jgi:hypothetical protein